MSLSPKEVRKAARTAITIFGEYGMDCCLFGSLACHINGMTYRDPKDVDLIVINSGNHDTEDLKEILVNADPRFYLVEAQNPAATYQVLWFRIGSGRGCKVDILTTGRSTDLNIPRVPAGCVEYIHPFNDLPVMPLIALLLLKLQGWTDHRHSQKNHERAKVRQDVADIRAMLKIAIDAEVHIDDQDSKWLPRWFRNQMGDRVEEYIGKFPGSQTQWESVGL